MDIQWGILRNSPNLVDAFEKGRQQKIAADTREGVQSALALYGSDPDAGASALMRYDPETALKLQDRNAGQKAAAARQQRAATYATDPKAARQQAFVAGDTDQVAAFDKMDADQRAMAQANAKEVYAIVGKLGEMPYEQRKMALQRLAPAIAEKFGIPPEVLAQVDPTDQWIDDKLIEGAQFAEKAKTYEIGGDIISVEGDDADVIYDGQATAPQGYRWRADGSLEFIPGGPADPRQAGTLAGSKRAPKTGGRGRGGGSHPKPPAGFIVDP